MMNYSAIATENGQFKVVETKSGFVMLEGLSGEEAKKKVRFLNFGGAFDGLTPSFFMERLERPTESVEFSS